MDGDGTPIPAETPEIITEEIRQILKAREEDSLPLTVETIPLAPFLARKVIHI